MAKKSDVDGDEIGFEADEDEVVAVELWLRGRETWRYETGGAGDTLVIPARRGLRGHLCPSLIQVVRASSHRGYTLTIAGPLVPTKPHNPRLTTNQPHRFSSPFSLFRQLSRFFFSSLPFLSFLLLFSFSSSSLQQSISLRLAFAPLAIAIAVAAANSHSLTASPFNHG